MQDHRHDVPPLPESVTHLLPPWPRVVPFGPRLTCRPVAGGDARGRSPAAAGSPSGTTTALTVNPDEFQPGPWEGALHLRMAGFATDGGVDGEPPRPRYLPR